MARMFGTDGVRGVAGTELTIELAMKLGQAGAYVLTKEQSHQPTIIIGCDTRISGGMLVSHPMMIVGWRNACKCIDGRDLFSRSKCYFCGSCPDTCNCISYKET